MERSFLAGGSSTDLDGLSEPLRGLIRATHAIPIGIAVAGLDGRIIGVNRRIQEALGYSPTELTGQHLRVIYGNSLNDEKLAEIIAKTLESGWAGELQVSRKDDSTFTVFLEISPMHQEDGTPLGIVLVARDITDQRAFQDRLLNEAKLGTLGLLVRNVTHEVRNHMAAIKMSLYLLENAASAVPEDAVHYNIASEEMNRIELFLRTLENFATPRAPKLRPCSLIEAVERGLEDARPTLRARTMNLRRQFPPSSPSLVLDREQIAQAVTQVAQNAAEAASAHAELHVVIKRQPEAEGASWLVEFRDDGPGVPPHLIDRVFDPFFSTRHKQLGIGLSNVRRILDLHGGEARLSSRMGHGTVVTLKIPETSLDDEATE